VAGAEAYLHAKFHCDPSNHLATIHQRHRQTDRQASWFLRPDCTPRSKCPQYGVPAERRAQFRVLNVPRSRISERAPFRIYEHAQCQFFERTSLQRTYVIPCRQQMGSSAVLRAHCSALVLAASTRCLQQAHSIGRGCRVQHTGSMVNTYVDAVWSAMSACCTAALRVFKLPMTSYTSHRA